MSKLIWDTKTRRYIDIEDVNNLSYAEKKYKLTCNKKEVGEGDSVDVTLETTNVPSGTLVPFEIFISGENPSDCIQQSLSGNFTVGELDSAFESYSILTFNTIADNLTDGKRFMTLSLRDIPKSVEIVLLDTSKTSEDSLPSYSLSSNADLSGELEEGSDLILTLNTSNVPDGNVPYLISGVISKSDLDSGKLSGNFTVSNDPSGNSVNSVTLKFKNDFKTEGDEFLKVDLLGLSESLSVKIKDTSKNPTFNLSASKKNVSSGESIKISLTTTNVPNGSIFPFKMINLTSSDISVNPSELDSFGDIVDELGTLTLSEVSKNLIGEFVVNDNKSERVIQISDISYLKNPINLVSVELLNGEKVNFNLKK